MNTYAQVALNIPRYMLFRSTGHPRMLPLNLTVSVTYRCNSRCRTCNVWKKKADEFTAAEFDRTFRSVGTSPYWFTMSGGEPFLRHDIVEICASVSARCRPGIINIPTNGILHRAIPEKVAEIAQACKGSQVIINLSIDGIGVKHDEIRGIEGNFERSMKTWEGLQAIEAPNLSLGVHTVISRFNAPAIPEIYAYFAANGADSYIAEIAEERVELDTVGSGITPDPGEYAGAADFLIGKAREERRRGISGVTQAFRREYYERVKEILRRRQQVLPCYAGFASAQIAPDGDVWTCCVRAEPVGNLRSTGYDFRKIWFGAEVDRLRSSIKNRECFCPLANAYYTNILCHPPSLARVAVRCLAR